jgi:hypothetical protein
MNEKIIYGRQNDENIVENETENLEEILKE